MWLEFRRLFTQIKERICCMDINRTVKDERNILAL